LISFDTNILVYAADRTAGERHRQAADLIERAIRQGNCLQTLQSLCEFFNVVTRKSGIEPSAAAAFVEGWRAVLPIEASTEADLADAMRAVSEHRLPFWDAMLWATARRAGVHLLVSEDFQDGRTIEGVRIVNPFAVQNAALIASRLPPIGGHRR
jgi:predicted nucleic acid-binding protein